MGRGPVGAPALVKYNDQSISAITEIATSAKDSMVLIKTLTASTSATLDFVDGSSDVVLDNTYPIYVFKFIAIHPGTDNQDFVFQGNVAGGSGYNETMTTTTFQPYHNEGDTDTALNYDTSDDQAQGTGYQQLLKNLGTDNDQNSSGELWLFNPSSTTFVKHFMAVGNSYNHNDYTNQNFTAGYFNLTGAIDEIQFKMTSGNIDAGTIKLYGIKDS